ncbi:MAG: regulatory protein RecX [Acutalibacteraceae bacterium]
MKVKITSRIGKRGKVNLYLNDEYLMSVPEDFWYSSPVRLTEEVDEAEFTEFLKTANAKSAYQKALELLSRRDYSSRMLANKLAEKFDSEAVAFAVEKAVNAGLVNDEVYARRLAEELVRNKGLAPRRIQSELIKKGISLDIAQEVTENLDINPDCLIIELLQTKLQRVLNAPKGTRRVFQSLLRKGYSRGAVLSAFRQLNIELDEE